MNLYQFTPIEANVPKIVDTIPDVSAIITLFNKACHKSEESKISFLYQIKDGFVNSALFPSLKE